MVSLVIVSHSATLAAGVQELAEQMVQGKVNLAVAGGIDDPEHPIGTDPIKVMTAIESVYSDDGVVVLMDLGSALMSAQTAVEFLMPEIQENVYLCPAPLIEGAIAAAVQASIGSSVEQVMAEAQSALAVKIEQIAPELAAATQPDVVEITGGKTLEIVIPNRLGLHARPAARFVATASQFEAEMQVSLGDKTANAKSINQVATLGVRQNDTIVITALGLDAAEALAAMQALANENFGDVDEELKDEGGRMKAETAVPAVGEWSGIPASPGIAIGPVLQYRPRLPKVKTRSIKNKQKQWQKLETAVTEARAEIKTLHTQSVAQIGAAEAAIFEAHDLFLADPDLLDSARQIIYEKSINAEAAWEQAINATAEQYRQIDDAYMQARAADILDVGQRVLVHLMKVERPSLDLKTPSILVAADLTPSDTAKLNPQTILGICVELGGATSHSAILARALGIPAIVGMGEQLTTLKDGQQIGLDGKAGRIWVDPMEDELAELKQKQANWVAGQQKAKESAKKTAVTKDKRHIEVAANIGSPNDIPTALDYGAEGVGLFRTEFLFLERDTAPTEEEQYNAYRQAADILQDKPIIIRTLDIGGDKPLPYLDQGQEDNPFLGWRGIRFCLDRPEVFKPQIRAILRAGYQRNVKMMFPMVSTVAELKAAKKLVKEVQKELKAEKVDFDKKMEVGIMIEVPSAATIADQLAKEADFFSIGTNDLTQYTMAADRGNANVANLANALEPAVLRLIRQTVEAAHHADIWVGVCGELAGNDLATAVLVGLGVDELSMSAPAIPAVKEQIRSFTIRQAQRNARSALEKDSPEAVLKFLQKK